MPRAWHSIWHLASSKHSIWNIVITSVPPMGKLRLRQEKELCQSDQLCLLALSWDQFRYTIRNSNQ